MGTPTDDDYNGAVALLADGLIGASDALRGFGIDHLPRPQLRAPAAVSAPPAAPARPSQPGAPAAATRAAAPQRAAAASVLPILPDAPVAEAIATLVASAAPAGERLLRLEREVIGDCTRCKLHRGRNKLVFGVGNPSAELVFVGEGPGADEDRQGVPFVGRAGQLLTKMIEAMKRKRDDVYICNVVKCRPPNNRDPEPDEVQACEGFLQAQLAIIKPRAVVCLGRHAAQTLLRTKTPITRLRGQWHTYQGIDVMPTYHPSFLLREEADPDQRRKREAWNDLKQVMQKLG